MAGIVQNVSAECPTPRTQPTRQPPYANQAAFSGKSFWQVVKWRMFAKRPEWPKWIDAPQRKIPTSGADPAELDLTFINHSTFLIHYHGLNILTDPVWTDRPSPFSFAGPKRVRPAGVKLEDLPKIDLILISHNHYEHLDLWTLKKLAARDKPLVLTGLGNGKLICETGLNNVQELDWWESLELGGLKIHFVPAQHFSARWLDDRMETLWGGFVLESPHGNVYFAGDTAAGPHEGQLQKRFESFRLSLLSIGAYEPRWFMKASHMNPLEAVEAHQKLNSQLSVGMHFGTFAGLTDEAIDQPLIDLSAALKERDVKPATFIVLDFGETREIPKSTH